VRGFSIDVSTSILIGILNGNLLNIIAASKFEGVRKTTCTLI